MINEKIKVNYEKGLHADGVADVRETVESYKRENLQYGEEIVIDSLTETEDLVILTVTIHAEADDVDVILNDLMRGENLKTEIL